MVGLNGGAKSHQPLLLQGLETLAALVDRRLPLQPAAGGGGGQMTSVVVLQPGTRQREIVFLFLTEVEGSALVLEFYLYTSASFS